MKFSLYLLLIYTICTYVHTSLSQPDTELTKPDLKQVLDNLQVLSQKVNGLQRDNQMLQATVSSLKASLKLQKDELADTNKVYQNKIKELTDKLQAQEAGDTRSVESEQDQVSFEADVGESHNPEENESKLGQRSSMRRQFEPDDAVAFYAGLSNSKTYQYGQNIIFDNVTLNIGTHYIPSHGIFVAPTSGLYVFSVTLMTSGLTDTHAAIYINEKLATRIKLYGSEHEYDTMSQTAIYQLYKMDAVSVKHTESNKTIHGYYTYFSGFLLSPTFTLTSVIG